MNLRRLIHVGCFQVTLSYKEAVAASSIANVAIAALFAGDLVKAGRAIQGDMFHERYRQKLVKEFATIKDYQANTVLMRPISQVLAQQL